MNIINKIFGTYSEREVKRVRKITSKILSLEPEMQKLSDDELRNKTIEFRNRLSDGESIDDILVEAFAVCREASSRVLGMKHFEVQLIGGIILHQGRISEMKTGEGKTLVATLPAYLHALTGKGVHIVTVNDYLASRDLNTMKPLYDFLGVTSSVITNESTPDNRRESYKSDITYITNNELGFDYLRDNMVLYAYEKVQRELNFAIVDEVDSILIDEARTPLIISGMGEGPTHLYNMVDVFVKSLKEDDYEIDEKLNSIILTDKAIDKLEMVFGIDNYADIENSNLRHHIDQSLRANYRMKRDKDYLIRNGEILIIDEFTGRVSEGRRYSDGLHQAIEAKEGVKIKPENKTLATITYQSLFRLYKRLSGMTGTAKTEEEEFREIYDLDVIEIPTNKPIARIDQKDKIYLTASDKYKAIIEDVKNSYEKGQPVLVGTSSIEKSELLSDMLKAENIPHQVLNAKYHELEAQIISKAGEFKSVTIATNMAGRGTDIKLGDGVEEVGGLKIIGTERHENRRIDNQLRGRAGRQGDSGESVFYISFEDDLMRVFSSERAKNMIANMSNSEDNIVIENKFLTNAIEKAQKNIESMHFQTRKETIEYDDIINNQRKIIYEQRNSVVEGLNLKSQIETMIEDVISSIVDIEFAEYKHIGSIEEFNIALSKLKSYLEDELFNHDDINIEELSLLSIDEIKAFLIEKAKKIYESKSNELNEEDLRLAERQILLSVVDQRWINHLTDLVDLKQSVKLQSYKQENPINAFIMQSAELFNNLTYSIKNDTVKYILKLRAVHSSNLQKDGLSMI